MLYDNDSHSSISDTQWSGSGFLDMENEDVEELLSRISFPLGVQGSFERLDPTDQLQLVEQSS
jgi:hypothetical protein